MKDGSKRETEKEAERESGTRKDVKGMPHEGGKRHEMGEYREGGDFHDCHRGK